ncbi:hypothetical protein [Alistipes sp. ZOR0009]|jgi:hypothetical protein|uniref:hypothetical protein n=1 Tax=Alistipes sp. ZOR0009 TaxID=1339253 RepID=UPI00064692F9|nr:hypothetical protein [Alistipes sp. ZOR0009]
MNVNIRLSKTGQAFFKSKKYQIRVNGNPIGQVNSRNFKLSENLLPGKYLIEVEEEGCLIGKDIVVNPEQMQTITINPSMTFSSIRGFTIGLAIIAIAVQFFMLDKVSLPLMFIPLIPLLFFGKGSFSKSFSLTIQTG